MLSWIFRSLRLGGVLTSPQAAPSGLQMTPPSLPGTENPEKHGSPDFILILSTRLSGDNQCAGSSAPLVSRWLGPGNRTFLEVASMAVSWWIVAF